MISWVGLRNMNHTKKKHDKLDFVKTKLLHFERQSSANGEVCHGAGGSVSVTGL